MPYTKYHDPWEDLPSNVTPIDAAGLDHLEAGIATAQTTGEAAQAIANADFLVGTTHAGLSAEIVVGPTPGGELGGTWAAPTVDPVHSGSSHATVESNAAAAAAIAHPPNARTISAGTGLIGGGDLSANRSLAANFGAAAGTVTQGDDARLSDARTPTAHKATHEVGGSDPFTAILPAQGFVASGKTGATTGDPFLVAGSTVAGAPTTGAHVAGEIVKDNTGRIFYCTVAGTPGTWVDVYGNLITTSITNHDADAAAHPQAFDAFAVGFLESGPDSLDTNAFMVEDFFGSGVADGQIGQYGWRVNSNTTGTIAVGPATQANHPGWYTLGTGTDPAGRQAINFGHFQLEGTPAFIMQWGLRVSALWSAGVDTGTVRFGLGDSVASEPTDGIYWEYDVALGTDWRARSAGGGVRENVLTGVTVAEDVWTKFRMVGDGGGNVNFFVDDMINSVATVSGVNLPVAGEAFGPFLTNIKTLGAAPQNVWVDYCYLKWGVAR